MREEDEGIEGEEADEGKTDQRREPFADIDAADHIHHEEEEEQDRHRGQKVGREVVEGGVLHAVRRVRQHVGEDEDP